MGDVEVGEAEFFVSGGTLPSQSKSYIERKADQVLLEHLCAGKYCYVLNARQMGKSSLCVRTMARLAERGIRSAFIDLTQIGASNLLPDQWYAGLMNEVGEALDLTFELLDYDEAKRKQSPMQRFFGGLRDVVLARIDEPLVIFVDEIDTTRNLPFDTDEFFAGIRECYNRRVRDPAFDQLTFCLIGVAVPNDLIRNPVTTPFNIGERIRVDDFTLPEVLGLAPALGAGGDGLARRVHHWTNGQPLLTQSICQEIVAAGVHDTPGVDALVEQLFFTPDALATNPNLADVANRALNDSEKTGDRARYRADILTTYERALRGAELPDDESNRVSVVLKLSGLMQADGRRLTIRNRIYRHVFDRRWIGANMPGQELIRQRQSFRRGVIRGVAITAAASVVVGSLGLYALSARQRTQLAEAKEREAERRLDEELYVSQMNSLRFLEETGNRSQAAAVLNRWRTSPHRGFEWSFWLARLHDSPEEYTLDDPRRGKQETGILSNDGTQVCITDPSVNAIVLVDRRTKKVLGSSSKDIRSVVATDAGIVTFSAGHTPIAVTNLASGRVQCQIGRRGYVVNHLADRDHANFVLLDETSLTDGSHLFEVWDLRSGTRVCSVPEMPVPFEKNSVSANCDRYLCIPANLSADSPELGIWDRHVGRMVDRFPYRLPAVLSASGGLVAYWDEQHNAIVRDIDAHREIYSSRYAREDPPVSIEIAPDDRTIVTVSSYGVATVRQIPSGRLIGVRNDLTALTPGQKGFPWIGSSSTVRLMAPPQRDEGIVGHADRIRRDGRGAFRLTSSGELAIVRLRDPALTRLPAFRLPKRSGNLTYNGLWCLVADSRSTEIVSVDGSQPSHRFESVLDNIAGGAEGDLLVGTTRSHEYIGLSKSSGKLLWRKHFEPDLRSLWISPEGRHLICATDDGKLGLIDPSTGTILRQSKAHGLSVSCVGFAANGTRMVTGGGDGLAILWDVDHLEKLVEFHGNEGKEIAGADISPDGRRVATCNTTGAWQLWNTSTGSLLTEVQASMLPLRSIVFTADGTTLLTAGSDGLVRRWRTRNDDPTVLIPTPKFGYEQRIR